ncbi:hypothetical protein BD413DRAFT_617158 [Trametes elegans]|nr:hypothetical protein BD413DRAFT_617158 [Trametes elegans]
MAACADSTARYHISVGMNCFIPTSFITVVRRFHESGEFVSSFEMGISTQRATINMHGIEKQMDAVLSRMGKKAEERIWQWRWDSDPTHFVGWHRENPVRYCYSLDAAGRPSGPMLAAFAVATPSTASRQGGPPRPASLTVYPDGQHIIDHILTSALIVERKRLTPVTVSMNNIFN